MELKEILAARRSTRKFSGRTVPAEVRERLLAAAFTAPSARNSRSTRIMTVEDRQILERMARMRDYGSAFLKDAPIAFVVAGDPSASGLWRENASIAATILQLAAVDEGLASCWIHVEGRPQIQDRPDGAKAAELLRELLPLPREWEVLCVVAAGYSDFHPAPLPPYDPEKDIIRVP
ncbi:MAG: nitroreductase family protein [Alistipes sp.]|nr:nitroreductase family protein [Alistipes sp.]